MGQFRVIIAGGGVAAIEGLLRRWKLTGDAVNVTLRDALLLAVGGRMAPAFKHVKTFRDANANELNHRA